MSVGFLYQLHTSIEVQLFQLLQGLKPESRALESKSMTERHKSGPAGTSAQKVTVWSILL